MAATDLATVSLDDAAEKLRDQIKSAFAELLTPEQWRALVRKELDRMFEPRVGWEDGRKVELPSEFASIVRGLFTKEVERIAIGIIKTGDWHPESGSFWAWGQFQGRVSKHVEEWLTENASTLLAVTLHQLMGNTAQGILDNVRDQYGPRCGNCGKSYPDASYTYCPQCGANR
jgi:hypothetical protein